MIAATLRYQPILAALRVRRPAWVLDVGSGPRGVALLWRGRVVGVDLQFKQRPLHLGVRASVCELPFADASCPTVVSCDMLEHLPPERRRAAVQEMARVGGRTILLSFPSGAAATRMYEGMARRLGPQRVPEWLEEHLRYGLPDADTVAAWLDDEGWHVSTRWYESAAAHQRLVLWEDNLPVKLLTYAVLRPFGPWLAPRLPIPSHGPKLRVFMRAERERRTN